MSNSLGSKAWINYFYNFIGACYNANNLIKDLSACNDKVMNTLNLKNHSEYKVYTTCMSGYDKSSNSVITSSVLGGILTKNFTSKEKFMPVIPSLKINDQSIAVYIFQKI
jgi:hypothetical protein